MPEALHRPARILSWWEFVQAPLSHIDDSEALVRDVDLRAGGTQTVMVRFLSLIRANFFAVFCTIFAVDFNVTVLRRLHCYARPTFPSCEIRWGCMIVNLRNATCNLCLACQGSTHSLYVMYNTSLLRAQRRSTSFFWR
jgi:hypothetical protein